MNPETMYEGQTPPTGGALDRLIRLLHLLEDGLLVSLLLAMILLAFGQIVLRNFFGTGVAWVDPLLRVLVLWLGLIGALVATRLDKQISIDVLTRLLGPRLTAFSRLVTRLFAAAVSGLIAWHAARFIVDEWQSGSVAFSGVPAWMLELVIPFGFGIIAARFLLQALAALPMLFPRETGS
ncbi:MAG: TRAP transporter small permease [Pseudomonadota bacterium]|nr:TRAP transporter small permease [Pseudomonadota bacterium]